MLKQLLTLIIAAIFLLACSEPEQKQESSANGDPIEESSEGIEMAKAEIHLPTIQCGTCAMKVEDALSNLDGIDDVNVDLKLKLATVTYEGSKLTMADMEKAVTDVGYDANKAVRNAEAYAALDACCKIPEDGGGQKH